MLLAQKTGPRAPQLLYRKVMQKALRLALRHGKFEKWTPSRARAMSRVRSSGTRTTETTFRMLLVRLRIKGWTLHPDGLPAKPDIYFPDFRLAIFLDGCFWHFCPRCGHTPKTNEAFWKLKLRLNRRRDRNDTIRLRRAGLRVLRIWEHELFVPNRTRLLRRFLPRLNNSVR